MFTESIVYNATQYPVSLYDSIVVLVLKARLKFADGDGLQQQ